MGGTANYPSGCFDGDRDTILEIGTRISTAAHRQPALVITMIQKGIIASLFDLSFRHFITPSLQRVLYLFLLLSAGLMSISAVLSVLAIADSTAGKLGALVIAGPVGLLVFLSLAIAARVSVELVIVVFRGVEYLREIRDQAVDSSERSHS